MVLVRNEVSNDVVELVIRQNLNEETVGEFRDALYAELDSPLNTILVNMEKVHSINSAAIGAILLFQKKAKEKGKRIQLVKCGNELYKTFTAIRLDRIIDIAE
jgi:anti-anti-sigma factor